MAANTPSSTPEGCKDYRTIVKHLYLSERRTLNEVREILESEYGYVVSESQMKKQLGRWGLAAKSVKLNRKEKAVMLQLQEGRLQWENKSTEFRRWKKPVDPRTLARFKDGLKTDEPILSLIDISERLSGVSYRTPSTKSSNRALSTSSSHRAVSRRSSSRATSANGGHRTFSRSSSHRATAMGDGGQIPPRAQAEKRWRKADVVEIMANYVVKLNSGTPCPSVIAGSSATACHRATEPVQDCPVSLTGRLFSELNMLQHGSGVSIPRLALGHVIATGGGAPQLKELPPKELEVLLFAAIEGGDNVTVWDLLIQGADPNICANSELTALELAIQHGQERMVHMLLDKGADLAMHQKDGLLPIHRAVVADRPELVKILILRGADPNGKSQAGQTPLHIAVKEGKAAIVELLLRHGVDANSYDCCLWTPLHIAVRWGAFTQILQELLKYGADLNAKNCDSNTPLHLAASWGTACTMRTLLEHGSAIVDIKNRFNLTPLQVAISSARDATIVATLLRHGADGNLKFGDGGTALHKAVFMRANDTVRLLLLNGVEFAARTPQGHTPLHIAVSYGNSEAVELLMGHDKDAAARVVHQDELLCLALRYQHFPIAKLLLQSGNEIADTALHWAVREGSIPAADFLLRNGADINARDQLQRTSAQIAFAKQDEAMKGWLSLKGAVDPDANVGLKRPADIGIFSYNGVQSRLSPISEEYGIGNWPLQDLGGTPLETEDLPLRDTGYPPQQNAVGQPHDLALHDPTSGTSQDLRSQPSIAVEDLAMPSALHWWLEELESQSPQEPDFPTAWNWPPQGMDSWPLPLQDIPAQNRNGIT